MKRIRTVIIVMILLVVAAIGIYFIANHTSKKNKEKEVAEAEKLIIFDFDENASTKLDIHNQSGDYIMEYSNENGWQMTNASDFNANSNTAINICTAMAELTAEKIINDSDTAKYGFDDPIELTVTSNGNEYTLYVGIATPTNENYYVMKKDDDNIYLIDYTLGLILSATKDSLKSQYIANFIQTEVEQFSLWQGSESDENLLFSMIQKNDGTWYMDKPYNDDSVYSSDISTFINDSIRDTIYSFVEENCQESDYEKYGFDDPQFVFEMSGSGKHTKVIFGDNTEDNTEMYGLLVDSGQVVTFYQNSVATLGYGTRDMMNSSIYSPDIDTIDSVKITMPDHEADLQIDEANAKYMLNGNEIDNSDEEAYNSYIAFFSAFNNTNFESVNRKDTPSGDAEVTVEYSLSDGTKAKIEYIPVPGADSNTYWTMKDGEYTGFIVRKKVIANITTCYEGLEEYIAK